MKNADSVAFEILQKYREAGMVVSWCPIKLEAIIDRKPMRSAKRLHNQFQRIKLDNEHTLLAVYRKKLDAMNSLN